MDIQQLDAIGKEVAGIVKDRYALESVSFSVVVNVVDGETMGALGDIQKDSRTRRYRLSPQQVDLLLTLPEPTARRMLAMAIDGHARALLNRRNNAYDQRQG
jgi:hypothetical protein